jgi:hypothetical protein
MHRSFVFRGGSLLALCSAMACSSLLGVEQPGEDAGSGGQGGDGSGGKESASGGKNSAGGGSSSGGKGPSGGRSSNGGSPSSGGAMGGDGPSGGDGPGDGGSGEVGGSGGSGVSTTVTGKVIDLFGRPLARIEIRIPGVDPVLTDANGKFTAQNVPEQYDLGFRFAKNDAYYETAYQFLGLTRRDPVLQVDDAVGNKYGSVEITAPNLPVMGAQLDWSVGRPVDVWVEGEIFDTVDDSTGAQVDYDGNDPFQLPFHALLWKPAAGASEYYAHASQNILLNDGEYTEVVLSTWSNITDTASIAGHAEPPAGFDPPDITAYINYPDGATAVLQEMPVVTGNNFSVPVPVLGENETFSVRAITYDDAYGFGNAHADGIAIGNGSNAIDLVIPEPPILQEPNDGYIGVNGDTVFRWTPSPAGRCVEFTAHADWSTRMVRIVTCSDRVKIPAELFNGFFPPPDDANYDPDIYWSVHYHGPFESTDEMTGENGYHDPYFDNYWYGDFPRGKNRPAKGTYARSGYRMTTPE